METTVKQCVPLNIVPYRGGYRARTQIEYADGNTQIKEFTGKSRGAVTQKMQAICTYCVFRKSQLMHG